MGELQLYSLKDSSRDAVGEAFEIFIGPSLKGAQGQFFTPRNVVNMVIKMIDPDTDEKILESKTQNLIQFNACPHRGVA